MHILRGAVNEKVIYRGAPSQKSLKTPVLDYRAKYGEILNFTHPKVVVDNVNNKQCYIP